MQGVISRLSLDVLTTDRGTSGALGGLGFEAPPRRGHWQRSEKYMSPHGLLLASQCGSYWASSADWLEGLARTPGACQGFEPPSSQ